MKLVRLIYASHLASPLTKVQTQGILSASERNNAETGITGFLCISPKFALQCLEGDRVEVNLLYNKIVRDERHSEPVILRYVEPWRRLFPEWHMGYSSELSSAAPESSRWRDGSGFNPYMVESDLIENVIEELCERSEREVMRV